MPASHQIAARYVAVQRQSPGAAAIRAAVRVIEPELLRQQVAQGGGDLLRQRGLRAMNGLDRIAAEIKRH